MRTALCGLMLLAACAAAQTVEGTVVNSVTGTGIPDVGVHLEPVSGGKRYHATTDTLGHFLFKDVEAGTYQFEYTSRDYLPSDVGSPRLVRIPDPNPVKLEGRMVPRPRISGRVVDANGDGVANARLEVIPIGSLEGTTTDATGKFELLLEGRGAYVLSLVPPTGLKPPDPEPDSDSVLVWARSFYPGVDRLESASKIVVSGDVPGIEMKPLAVPAHAIRGVLLNPDGTPAPKVAITLDDGQLSRSWQKSAAAHTESNSDGVFEFPQVVDGEWRLAAEVEMSGRKLRATQWIEMAGRELEGVNLLLAPPFTVRGRVVMETPKGTQGGDPSPVLLVPHVRSTRSDIGRSNWMLWPSTYFEPAIPPNVPGGKEAYDVTIELSTDELRGGGAVLAKPDADGSFSLENVYPGRYRIVSWRPQPPYYVAAVRVGEADLATAEVELSPNVAPITVVYKTDGGSVRGTAEKCASGVVLLVPQDPAMQSIGFFRSARCDSSDRYELTAVRSGDYDVLAFAGFGGIPQLDDILISQAKKVTVHADEIVSADLRAIRRPWD